MNLDLGSFAFGFSIQSGGGTPSWGTAMGQSKPDYKFTYLGAEAIVIGMLQCAVPLEFVSLPLGKGGRIYKASELNECLVSSLFRKVYINGVRINHPFVMVLIREESESHAGRKSIKYSDKNTYVSNSEQYSNKKFIQIASETLGLGENACWFVYKFEVYNQDELHMYAVIVDDKESKNYENSLSRKNKWLKLIPDAEKESITHALAAHLPLPELHLQQIYFGAPGTGKSHEIKDQIKKHKSFRITFHPDTDYSSFVGAYKPTSVEVPMLTTLGEKAIPVKDMEGNPLTENKIIYTYVKQAFLNAYIEAWKERENENPQPVFLVIEEINRGNCAQIFGDIFQLLDRNDAGFSDYAVVPDTDLSRHVRKDLENLVIADKEEINALYEECEADMVDKVLKGDVLLLPKNLYIWATMNTSDQSLFPIDSAFKRRWDWKYMKIKNHPEEGYSIKIGESETDWWEFIQKINEIIASMTSSADKQLGYFFCKAKDGKIDEETFVSKVIFYLWNDVFKDYGFEDASLFRYTNKDGIEKDLTFPDFFDENGDKVDNERLADFVNKVMNWKRMES